VTTDPQTIEPLAVPISTAAKLLSVSRSVFYSWLSAGKIGPTPTRLGDGAHAKPLFSLSELRDWIAAKDFKTGALPSRQRWIEIQESKKCQTS
jgi:predicted DNA-binding transcriptional regulator AlpA